MNPEEFPQRYEVSFLYGNQVRSQNISEERYKRLMSAKEVKLVEVYKISCSPEGKITFELIKRQS
jgi:hypothetical protein